MTMLFINVSISLLVELMYCMLTPANNNYTDLNWMEVNIFYLAAYTFVERRYVDLSLAF